MTLPFHKKDFTYKRWFKCYVVNALNVCEVNTHYWNDAKCKCYELNEYVWVHVKFELSRALISMIAQVELRVCLSAKNVHFNVLESLWCVISNVVNVDDDYVWMYAGLCD